MNGSSGSNKRKHRRFTVDVMDIQGFAVLDTKVVINDISIAGLSLYTDRKLEPGKEYNLRISDKDRDVNLRGTVIWASENKPGACREGSVTLKYAAGMQLNDLDPETASGLINFIETHLIERHTKIKPEMSGRRCNIRFHVGQVEKATLRSAGAYRVLQLSIGGVLIKSHHALEPDSRLHMEINIPHDFKLAFIGRVKSCIQEEGEPGGMFDIGIEFADMPDQGRARLKQFIKRLYLEDAGFSVD